MKIVLIADPDRVVPAIDIADADIVLVHESDSTEVEILKSRDEIEIEVIG